MRRPRYLILVVVTALMALFVGCSKVSTENYDKIQTGMTRAQVEQILGKGTEQSGGGFAIGDLAASAKVVKWGGDDKSITITFTNDKVVLKTQSGL